MRIGYFLRHSGNLYYFESIKPYLDRSGSFEGIEHHILAPQLMPGYEAVPEYEDDAPLFTSDLPIGDCDLVFTPTFCARRIARVLVTAGCGSCRSSTACPTSRSRMSATSAPNALCLCAGRRQVDRLLSYERAMAGYPKFDQIPTLPRLFDNKRKRSAIARLGGRAASAQSKSSSAIPPQWQR
jgi:hypothetical protein